MSSHKFSKNERLSSVKAIQAVFSGGRSFVVFPFKFIFTQPAGSVGPNQILFTVPKRNFKRAHDRNRVKRMLKEIYRLEKQRLSLKGMNIAVIYLAKEKIPFTNLKNKLTLGLDRLNDEH